MNTRYTLAFDEVSYILNQLEPKELNKIPKEMYDLITKNSSKKYFVDYKNLKQETYAILALLYRKFLAPNEEKLQLEIEYRAKLKKEKEGLE